MITRVKRHKDDCLCAICIMKRRRQEREAREAQVALEVGGQSASPQVKLSKTGMSEEYKQEVGNIFMIMCVYVKIKIMSFHLKNTSVLSN